jgi:hypothetical protein
MGHNDHIDFDLYQGLQEALARGYLNEDVHKSEIGIAKQVIDRGIESLSSKQRFLYDKTILPALVASANDAEVEEKIIRSPE